MMETVNQQETKNQPEVKGQPETKWYVLRVVSGKERKVKEYLGKHKEIKAVTIPEVGHYSIIKSKLVIEEIVNFLK